MSMLCAMPLHALHYATIFPFRLFTLSHPTRTMANERINNLFFVLHLFYTPSPLDDHHGNSTTLLVVTPSLFIINIHYGNIPLTSLAVRHFIFSVTVELILSVAVTNFDTFPYVNSLYDQSSFH
jgi:hypothetical protein